MDTTKAMTNSWFTEEAQLLEQYSVAELLGASFRPGFYSTAGAEWLTDSYAFFGPEQHFCLWVDVVPRWVTVDIKDGSLIDPDIRLVAVLSSRYVKQLMPASNLVMATFTTITDWHVFCVRKISQCLSTPDAPGQAS